MSTEYITTNNPFMDNIISYLKKLAFECILKNEEEANRHETLDSVRQSDLYLSCMNNTVTFDSFESFPIEILQKSLIPNNLIRDCYRNKNNIPSEYRRTVVEHMKDYIIDTYVEYNNYYRMLNGLPNVDDPGIYITEDIQDINKNIPVHEMSNESIRLLENNGILNSLREQYPDKKYLNFLGEKKISIYKARKAYKFALLYCPKVDSDRLTNKFIELIERNRVYVLKTIYSEAFKYNSDYYDNFIELFIKIQTIIDIINDIPEIIIRRDFFDSDSIRDMFLSHGIDYFPEIPMRYQLAMIKNLNTLLKYKSTTKNIVDICGLFGFNNIEIFKYYLLKDRKVDIEGNYINPELDENGNPIENSVYELKFVKVPVNEIADDYIRNRLNHFGYDEIVLNDPYWNGTYDHDEVKNRILTDAFNYKLTKYLSIDTIYDMSNLSFELAYFFNMIFDNRDLEENLKIPLSKITYNRTFKLTDVICLLYILTYENIGIEDTILDTTSKVLHVTGFNFQADLSELASYLASEGYTMEELGIDGFIIPKGKILTYNELLNIYTKNKNIYKHVIKQMHNADGIRIYRIYKKIYDALMVSQLNTSMFKDRDGNFAGTYTNYLRGRDSLLYEVVSNIKTMEGQEKATKISELMDNIILSLDEYLSSEEFDFAFTRISNISSEMVKEYIYKIINFFKSHTVQLLSMNVIYTLNDRLNNKILIIDDVILKSIYHHRSPSRHNVAVDEIVIPEKSIYSKHGLGIRDNIFIIKNI